VDPPGCFLYLVVEPFDGIPEVLIAAGIVNLVRDSSVLRVEMIHARFRVIDPPGIGCHSLGS